MSELSELNSKRETLENELGEIEHQIEKEKVRLVKEKPPPINEGSLSFSNCQTCEKSPTEFCVYNDREDPRHDDCIYCREPEDRG